MSSAYNPALSNATTNLPNAVTSLNFALINGFEISQIPEPGSISLLAFIALIATLGARHRQS